MIDIATFTTPKMGEIYLADLGEQNDSKQGGIRPVVITSNNFNNAYNSRVHYVPMTSKKDKRKLVVHSTFLKGEVEGLFLDTTAIGEQNESLPKQKLIKKLGELSEDQLALIGMIIAYQQPVVALAFANKNVISQEILARVMAQ